MGRWRRTSSTRSPSPRMGPGSLPGPPSSVPRFTLAPPPQSSMPGSFHLRGGMANFPARGGRPMRRRMLLLFAISLAFMSTAEAQKPARKPASPATQKAAGKPNILVIWGDDIGLGNVSAYTLGQMGYKTPNIDRIAREGALFTDLYGQQSCTAGRGAFLTGQSPFRTGL